MVNTFEQAMAKARAQHKPGLFPTGQCLMRVRMLFGVPAKWGTAAEAWAKAKQKHTGPPSEAPAGSIGFWTGGSHGFGHVAPMLGGGLCDSTDYVNRGGFGICHADDITVGWRLRWAGYTYDLNGVTVYVPPEPRKPPVPLDPKKVPQGTHYTEYVEALEKADHDHGRHIASKYTARVLVRTKVRAAVAAGPKIAKGK